MIPLEACGSRNLQCLLGTNWPEYAFLILVNLHYNKACIFISKLSAQIEATVIIASIMWFDVCIYS